MTDNTTPRWHPNNSGSVAVSNTEQFETMDTCPRSHKVQLLNEGGVATQGVWDGRDDQWVGWCAIPGISPAVQAEIERRYHDRSKQ